MKKFTENINENVNRYAGNQIIYNEINNIINETLTPMVNGENSDKVSLIGNGNLVKELSKIVENEIIKTKIGVLENFKKNPMMIQERKGKKDFLNDLKNDYKKIANSIVTSKTVKQCETNIKLIQNYSDKYENIGNDMGAIELINFDRSADLDNRISELQKSLKDKVKEIISLKTKKQVESVKKLITNFMEKYEDSGFNIGAKGNIGKRIDFDRKSKYNQRISELQKSLKDKVKEIEKEEKEKKVQNESFHMPDGTPITDIERAKTHYEVNDSDWDALTDAGKKKMIKELPERKGKNNK